MVHPDLIPAVQKAQLALHFNQEKLGHLMNSSERTVQRWYAGRSHPSPNNIAKLAAAVYPRDADIARRLAACIGQSLETLGIVQPPTPAPAAPTPAPSPYASLLGESVVSAAADVLDVSPRVARPAVLAAVERAKAAELSLDELLTVLRPPASAKRDKT